MHIHLTIKHAHVFVASRAAAWAMLAALGTPAALGQQAVADRFSSGSVTVSYSVSGASSDAKITFSDNPGRWARAVLDLGGETLSSNASGAALESVPHEDSTSGPAPAVAAFDSVSDTGSRVAARGELLATQAGSSTPLAALDAEAHLRDSGNRFGLNAVAQASFQRQFTLSPRTRVEFQVAYRGAYRLIGVSDGRSGSAGVVVTVGAGLGDVLAPAVRGPTTYLDAEDSFEGRVVRVVENTTDSELSGLVSVMLDAGVYNFELLSPTRKAEAR